MKIENIRVKEQFQNILFRTITAENQLYARFVSVVYQSISVR